MIQLQKCVIAATILMTYSLTAQPCVKLKPVKWVSVAVPEPSDICYNSKGDTYFIVSDNGILSETDADGKVIRKAIQKNADFEAVYCDETQVYAVDEAHRKIYSFDIGTLKVNRTITVPYSGGRNKGYEAMTFNKSRNTTILITEKEPITLFELDANYTIVNQVELQKIATDIASATYYNDALWLLSDEDMKIFKLNPTTYEVLGKWSLPVINPEGLAFDKDGNLMITCDDMQRIYYFTNPEKS